MTYLIDFGKQEITLVDAAGKRFATMPMKDFAEKLGASVSAVTAQTSLKSNFPSRKTGRIDTIQGTS
jgi:hypothetical protein